VATGATRRDARVVERRPGKARCALMTRLAGCRSCNVVRRLAGRRRAVVAAGAA
jgi:hypothetical protein